MKAKWVLGIGIAIAALTSLFFVIKLNLDFAILSMMALFTMTNASRAVSFKQQGLEKESRWMRWLAIVFGLAFVVILALIVT
ncbi:hypothetical protein [Sporosarcina sp. Te-1]|uniref:hypothetical protein n=1 Tax=Sporosarcina sp. Te-1 TaxID=2818390 RepID=UPI001A9D237A|nr:hypothetical protein [Sporosarcina sp. Te-1]QTD39598.1 hypothetical protein J3U78_12125 [Sporosarcina sp. Te-1]